MSGYGPLFTGELKPCPFCGNREAMQEAGYGERNGRDSTYIVCGNEGCAAAGPDRHTHDAAAKAWNRRKLPKERPTP